MLSPGSPGSQPLTQPSTCTAAALFADSRSTAIAQCGTSGSAWMSLKTVAVRSAAVIEAARRAAQKDREHGFGSGGRGRGARL